MSSLNVKLLDELQVLRKYKLSIIACAPSSKFVDSTLLGSDILDGFFKKPYRFKQMRENQKIALYQDLLEDFGKTLFGIPASKITFDTWGTAPFKERSPIAKPKFTDSHQEILWRWSHGETYKDIGCSHMMIYRLSKKFVRQTMEKSTTANVL